MKAIDLAHIVTDYVNKIGDTVSHKKLQKLLYYVEAWHLVNFSSSIIDEDFQAWVHGPVIPELYHSLKEFGFNDLRVINDEHDTVEEEIKGIIKKYNLSADKLEFIGLVLNRYGVLSSLELELLSHSESPWIEARNGSAPHQRCTTVISKERMKEFYSSLN